MSTPTFSPGDKVAYSVQFLRAIGCSHGDLARARGVVQVVRRSGHTYLLTIDWGEGHTPTKVMAGNMAHVGPNARFCDVD